MSAEDCARDGHAWQNANPALPCVVCGYTRTLPPMTRAEFEEQLARAVHATVPFHLAADGLHATDAEHCSMVAETEQAKRLAAALFPPRPSPDAARRELAEHRANHHLGHTSDFCPTCQRLIAASEPRQPMTAEATLDEAVRIVAGEPARFFHCAACKGEVLDDVKRLRARVTRKP